MKILRLVAASLLWPLLLAFEAVLWIVGLAYVAVLARLRRAVLVLNWDKSDLVFGWDAPGAYLFGNLEHGVSGPTDCSHPSDRDWCLKARFWSFRKRCVSWYLRNPVNNERFSRLGICLRASRMEWIGNSTNPWRDWKNDGAAHWLWCRQGWRAGLWCVTRSGMTYRIGTKIWPDYDRPIDRYQGLVTIQRRRAHFDQ